MKTYSVKDLAELYKVCDHTVLAWIRSGELKALNVGVSLGRKKPRWRITEESLKQFELLRSSTPPVVPTRKRKRRDDIIEYY